jgi:hypothetical protein
VKIFNVVGKLIIKDFISSDKAEINLTELEAGVYFIEIKNQRMKVIKQ